VTGLLGGTFNPPHNGHIALADAARRHFDLDELTILVAVNPGHKEVQLGAESRLELARAAFPDYEVELDPHERTVDLLVEGRWNDPLFLIGADQFAEFLTWKDPEGVIERARIGVDEVLGRLSSPERVELFDIEPVSVSSREIRDRVARGEPIDGLVPPDVAALIHSLGLYRRDGYTSTVNGTD